MKISVISGQGILCPHFLGSAWVVNQSSWMSFSVNFTIIWSLKRKAVIIFSSYFLNNVLLQSFLNVALSHGTAAETFSGPSQSMLSHWWTYRPFPMLSSLSTLPNAQVCTSLYTCPLHKKIPDVSVFKRTHLRNEDTVMFIWEGKGQFKWKSGVIK